MISIFSVYFLFMYCKTKVVKKHFFCFATLFLLHVSL